MATTTPTPRPSGRLAPVRRALERWASAVASSAPGRSARRRPAVAVALVLLGLFLLLGLVLRRTGMGSWVDLATLDALEPLHGTPGQSEWWAFTQFGTPAAYAEMGLALVAVAAVRRRWRLLAVIPVTMLCSELSAQGIKLLLDDPRALPAAARIGDASWPSGHSTAAMTVALLAALIAPRRMRPTVAVLGTGVALGTGIGLVIYGYHYPSDILGGFLCAGIWVALAVHVLGRWEAWRPAHRPVDARPLRRRHLVAPVVLVALGLLTAIGKAQTGAGGIVGVVRDNTAATIVLAATATLAVALAAAVAASGARARVDGEVSGPRPVARGARPRRWRPGRG